MLIAKNIQWDIDLKEGETYEEAKKILGLPDDMEIPDGMTDEDEISDYLSKETGFCHYGFDLIKKTMTKLEKLLIRAFENKGGKNSYKSGKYVVAFEDRAYETLFWIYENDIPVMEGNTFNKEIQFNVSDVDFEYYISAIETLNNLLGYKFRFSGEIYEEYLENHPIKNYTVIGYDKDNDVYVKYKQFHQRTIAESFAKELKKGIEKGTLIRKCSDGTLEPIDWVQVVNSEDFDKVFWTSYEHQEGNMSESKKERLNNLPVISKELADKIVKLRETEVEFFFSQTEEMNQMSFLELCEFVRKHSEFVMGLGRDDIEKRMFINFRLKSTLSVKIFQDMGNNQVDFADSFGIWNENKKLLGFFNSDEINYMLLQAYKTFFANATSIEYKGIVFDNWTLDEDAGLIYGEMCEHCAKKYKDLLSEELCDGGMGVCSVKGCDVVGMDADTDSHYYVDFKPELIHIRERKTAKEYALEVYGKEGSFVRQIDVLSTPEECIKMAEELSDECLDNEEFHITEIVYELLSDGSTGEELESSTARLVDCL